MRDHGWSSWTKVGWAYKLLMVVVLGGGHRAPDRTRSLCGLVRDRVEEATGSTGQIKKREVPMRRMSDIIMDVISIACIATIGLFVVIYNLAENTIKYWIERLRK